MERILKSPPVVAPVDTNIKRPLWSVMIPTYNCIKFLAHTIESVLAQDPGTELMQIEVIDDCSTDGDVEALVNELSKGRIGFYRQAVNVGHHRNFATCLQRSTGVYVHLLHGDDAVKVGFYKEIESLFEENPDAGAAFTNNGYIDEHGYPTFVPKSISEHPGILNNFLECIAQKQMLQFSSMVVKRKVYEHLGGYYGVNYCEDWEMWIRIAAHYPVAYSPVNLALYRGGQGNGSSITSQALINGDNFRNVIKVIELAQKYFPKSKRRQIMRIAKKNYAEHIAKAANKMYKYNKKVAFSQGFSALKMYKSLRTTYWILRLLSMDIKHKLTLQKPSQFKEGL